MPPRCELTFNSISFYANYMVIFCIEFVTFDSIDEVFNNENDNSGMKYET